MWTESLSLGLPCCAARAWRANGRADVDPADERGRPGSNGELSRRQTVRSFRASKRLLSCFLLLSLIGRVLIDPLLLLLLLLLLFFLSSSGSTQLDKLLEQSLQICAIGIQLEVNERGKRERRASGGWKAEGNESGQERCQYSHNCQWTDNLQWWLGPPNKSEKWSHSVRSQSWKKKNEMALGRYQRVPFRGYLTFIYVYVCAVYIYSFTSFTCKRSQQYCSQRLLC